jgi:hypothetical protein
MGADPVGGCSAERLEMKTHHVDVEPTESRHPFARRREVRQQSDPPGAQAGLAVGEIEFLR